LAAGESLEEVMATQTNVPAVPAPVLQGNVQVTVDSVVNPSAVAAVIAATPSTAPPIPPSLHFPNGGRLIYTHLFVCTGTATFRFEDTGAGIEHSFLDFDLPDPPKPDPELEDPLPFHEPGPSLVFNNPFFPLTLFAGHRGLNVADAFTATASPASFDDADPGHALWAVDFADADWNEFTGRITLRAQLAVQGDGGTTDLNRMAYQVTFLAGIVQPL
jgi:hypothetical protein